MPGRSTPSKGLREPSRRRALMWFRADLRVEDNRALAAAAAWAEAGVVAVFLISPEQWREHDWAAVKVEFILRHLRELSARLGRLNIPLIVETVPRFEGAARALAKIAGTYACSGLFFNREYEVNEARRDEAVAALMAKSGVEVQAFDDQVVLPPGSVRTADGRPFTVFTPFKNAWFKRYQERGGVPLVAAPVRQAGNDVQASAIPDRVEGFESSVDPALWPAGEAAAMERLGSFAANRLREYKAKRDIPSVDGTSALSPALATGAISARQCLHAALEANKGKLEGGGVGADQWISELVWREFYKHLIHAFPRLCMGRAFKPATEGVAWRYDKKDFEAWCEGRTGVPIVDAAMRQLNTTGWMHNRLRMVAAMYLTKDLFIDWRWGEKYFMQRLIDGDLASNNGGWQWSASTGTDAAPYFRIFNPISQSRTHDAEGAFIRRWIPELASLDGEAIHDPSELPPLVRARLDYPEPIVDHAKARERVMREFKAIKV